MRRPAQRLFGGFTLVELLVVMAIMIILLALILPATTSLMRSMNIGRAASMITDEMNFARQTALSRNRDVEVRLYLLPSSIDSSVKQFRAIRVLLADGTDATKSAPLTRLKYLPDPIIISKDPTYSTVLDYANSSRSGLVHTNETLPSAGPVEYVSFLFRANGGTSLKPVAPPTGNWFLTLYAENAKLNGSTGLPLNYFTAQIDPVTGRIRSYRP
ncbi:hypothetical protein BH09VER1_BH09VER1_31200 [soil metagenome]